MSVVDGRTACSLGLHVPHRFVGAHTQTSARGLRHDPLPGSALFSWRARLPGLHHGTRRTGCMQPRLRKRTRTPPGFKDDGDGDFFIWADFLTGLQLAQAKGSKFVRAILVTRDQKVDWSRAGIAHPILVAEMKALLGISFEIWSDERLNSEIEKALADSP